MIRFRASINHGSEHACGEAANAATSSSSSPFSSKLNVMSRDSTVLAASLSIHPWAPVKLTCRMGAAAKSSSAQARKAGVGISTRSTKPRKKRAFVTAAGSRGVQRFLCRSSSAYISADSLRGIGALLSYASEKLFHVLAHPRSARYVDLEEGPRDGKVGLVERFYSLDLQPNEARPVRVLALDPVGVGQPGFVADRIRQHRAVELGLRHAADAGTCGCVLTTDPQLGCATGRKWPRRRNTEQLAAPAFASDSPTIVLTRRGLGACGRAPAHGRDAPDGRASPRGWRRMSCAADPAIRPCGTTRRRPKADARRRRARRVCADEGWWTPPRGEPAQRSRRRVRRRSHLAAVAVLWVGAERGLAAMVAAGLDKQATSSGQAG